MTLTDFARLPPAVLLLVVVMLWPAIWAAAGLTTALATDVGRLARRRRALGGGHTPQPRTKADGESSLLTRT